MQLWNRRRGFIAQSWELYFLFFLFRRIVKRELSTRRRGQRRLKWGLGLYSNSNGRKKTDDVCKPTKVCELFGKI